MSFTRTPTAPRSSSTCRPALASCSRLAAWSLRRIPRTILDESELAFQATPALSSNPIRSMRTLFALLAVGFVLFVAACNDETNGGGKEAAVVPSGPVKGKMTVAQWPLYIDPGKNGTIAQFEKDTGVRVKYVEEINDNVEFF